MPYANELMDAFKASKIRKIAIIDDAYDPVAFDKIAGADLTKAAAALRELKEDHPAAPEIAQLEAALGADLPIGRAELEKPETLQQLWSLYWNAAPDAAVRKPLAPVFLTLERDKRDKHLPLDRLKEILKSTTGVTAVELPSTTKPEEVLDYDLLFLDFFLGDEVPGDPDASVTSKAKETAKKASINFLEQVVRAADKGEEFRTPLVMLISSVAKADDLPEFRAAAGMLASKMAFLPKRFVQEDPDRAQHAVAGLARHRSQADALWKFLHIWKGTVNQVADEMMTSLRELDLTDYSYLQEYRLSAEKTPLSQYVASLFSGHLTDLVERKMQQKGAPELMAKARIDKAIPGRVSPTKAITQIYSSMTTSQVPVAEGPFKPRAWAGDIFLQTESYNEVFGTSLRVKKARKGYPKVLAVVTPACDLIPDRGQDNPLQTVTMIGGDLVPLAETHGPTTNLIMLNGHPFVVTWNPKWPITSTVDSMATNSALSGRYQWVGRLRDLYHAELQHKLFSDVGRVGLPAPPTMPEFVAVRVLVKTGRGGAKYEEFRQFSSLDQAAWAFGAAKGRAYCLREDLAWELKAWVAGLREYVSEKELAKLSQWTENPDWLRELQHPIEFNKTSNKVSGGNNGVTYHRVDKPSEFVAVNDQTAFVVVFARTPASPSKAPVVAAEPKGATAPKKAAA